MSATSLKWLLGFQEIKAEYESVWAQEPVWMFRREDNFVSAGT